MKSGALFVFTSCVDRSRPGHVLAGITPVVLVDVAINDTIDPNPVS